VKTLSKTIPYLFHVQTPSVGANPPVAPGCVRLHFVQFETVEMKAANFSATKFSLPDANSPHMRALKKILEDEPG